MAYTSGERSKNAQSQVRDRYGRWITQGANVRWRADGQDWAGTIDRVENGQAVVRVKHPGGNDTVTTLPPKSLSVMASKATLSSEAVPYFNNVKSFHDSYGPNLKAAVDKNGNTTVKRSDGYSAQVSANPDKQQKANNGDGNPLLYQLYAPNGRSLGQYTGDENGPSADLDEMANEDSANGSNDSEDITAEGTDTSAPDGGADSGDASGGDAPVFFSNEDWFEIVENEKKYSVPQAVREAVLASFEHADVSLSEEDIQHAGNLAYSEFVGLDDIKWISNYFDGQNPYEGLRGGYPGRKWANKILTPRPEDLYDSEEDDEVEDESRYDFDDDEFAYFAISDDEETQTVSGLICVDYSTNALYYWGPNGFEYNSDVEADEYEAPVIIPVDAESAEVIAKWLDAGETDFLASDTNPEERALFEMAEGELDLDELDDLFDITITAAAGYTSAERSVNAKRQKRGAGGRFGSQPHKMYVSSHSLPTYWRHNKQKAFLPSADLPLVQSITDRINQLLQKTGTNPNSLADDSAGFQDETAPATQPTGDIVYFAIVDDVDKSAVMDVIAISKENGQPSAWRRSGGTWVNDPEALAQLQGTTPPPVVELTDAETIKNTLAQIDQYDSENGTDDSAPAAPAAQPATPATSAPQAPEAPQPVAAAAFTEKQRKNAAKKGYALPDGSYPINDVQDLKNAVKAIGRAPESKRAEVKKHIRKRARALRRMDLVPEDWRSLSSIERGEIEANSNHLFGEFGEIIASGVPGIADTPKDLRATERLKNYWAFGKGVAKWRPGTPGDLTRLHRHLAKYVGPERAWGLAQNIHKRTFAGLSNYKTDKAAGESYTKHPHRGKH